MQMSKARRKRQLQILKAKLKRIIKIVVVSALTVTSTLVLNPASFFFSFRFIERDPLPLVQLRNFHDRSPSQKRTFAIIVRNINLLMNAVSMFSIADFNQFFFYLKYFGNPSGDDNV